MLTRGQKRLMEDVHQSTPETNGYAARTLPWHAKKPRSQGIKRSPEEPEASTSNESKKTRAQGEKRSQEDGPNVLPDESLDPKRRRPTDPEQTYSEPTIEKSEEMDVEGIEEDIFYDAIYG